MAFRNPLIDALVILVIVLVIFGPKRLPQIGKGLGDGIREFKDSITSRGSSTHDDEPAALTESRTGEAAPPVDAAVAGTPRPAPDAHERAS